MSIVDDTHRYELWLKKHCQVDEMGLSEKHRKMSRDVFKFYRATCYRFARKLPHLLPELSATPAVQSVGDLHIANFGTWRDAEGRLVWGVNDFDDSAILPYAFDLVRLATSARLGLGSSVTGGRQADAILDGYRKGLSHPGPRFVDVDERWMRELVRRPSARPKRFFAKLGCQTSSATPTTAIVELLSDQLPAGCGTLMYRGWQRGGGSLGRPRVLAIGTWHGGPAVREAKALVPSSWDWAAGRDNTAPLFLIPATGRFRSPDPFLAVRFGYVVRRLAPDSQKLDGKDCRVQRQAAEWLSAMGRDLASIHVAANDPTMIGQDLDARDSNWLEVASARMEAQTRHDFEVWTRHFPPR